MFTPEDRTRLRDALIAAARADPRITGAALTSIARGRAWQAEYMISGMRDQVLALACLRHGVPAVEGRGIDRLPPEATEAVATGLVRALDAAELRRAFRVVTEALIAEIER